MLDVHFCHRLTITTKQEGSFLQQKINYTTKHLSNSVCAHAITVLVCGQGGGGLELSFCSLEGGSRCYT